MAFATSIVNHANINYEIDWPAVIKIAGDDELVYVGNADEWTHTAESCLYNHRGDDLLIDSCGRVFSLDHPHHNTIEPVYTGDCIELEAFIRLVRIHASNTHRCCIEKINFRSIAEGIGLVAGMDDIS